MEVFRICFAPKIGSPVPLNLNDFGINCQNQEYTPDMQQYQAKHLLSGRTVLIRLAGIVERNELISRIPLIPPALPVRGQNNGRRLPLRRPIWSQVLTPRDRMFTGEVNTSIMHTVYENATFSLWGDYSWKVAKLFHGLVKSSMVRPPIIARFPP